MTVKASEPNEIDAWAAVRAKLNARGIGSKFYDFWGTSWEILKIDASYPQPGYVCKYVSGPYPTPNEVFVPLVNVRLPPHVNCSCADCKRYGLND